MIPLTGEMTRLLRDALAHNRPDLLYVVDTTGLVRVDSKLGDDLRMAVLDQFTANGLSADSEPNELGMRLEALIDHLASLYM